MKEDVRNKLEEAYQICLKKINKHMTCLDVEHPFEYRESKDGHYEKAEPGYNLDAMFNWMTSFVIGLVPLCYRTEKSQEYLIWANGCKRAYHDKIFRTPLETMHDIGFLYSPYSVAMYMLTGDMGHRDDAMKAADELLKRFDIKGRYIDAWGRMDNDNRIGRAIVDCMINIQLLFWAWKESGHTIYRDVAKAHADTTIRYFVREDGSVCHSFEFDRNTGDVIRENNDCGYGNGSYWARGTAWMIYGLAMTARYLQEDYYYEVAEKILEVYLKEVQSDVRHSCVPIWDFRLPDEMPAAENRHRNDPEWDVTNIDNCKYNIDTSAAVIVACGMLEMDQYDGTDKYYDFIEDTLIELCDKYLNKDVNTLGILSHQNGCMVYEPYGDFFFVQILQQFLYRTQSCW